MGGLAFGRVGELTTIFGFGKVLPQIQESFSDGSLEMAEV